MKSLFRHENVDEINSIHVHDAMFYGYVYDYSNRTISFQCEDSFRGKKLSFLFRNVAYYEMISCQFWGESDERLNGLTASTQSPFFQKLSQLQKEQDESNKKTFAKQGLSYDVPMRTCWNCGIQYFQVSFELITGDRLTIIAEELEFEEMDWPSDL